MVPGNATTGRVRLERESTGVVLQIVPVVSGIGLSFSGSYGDNGLTLSGSGFAEGITSVSLGDTTITDTGRYSGIDTSTGSLSLRLPIDAPTGPISVTTVGGTSAAYAIAFTGIAGTATSGTPANVAVASANPGDTVTLSGTNLSANTWIIFRTTDNGGTTAVKPTSVAADGTSATVIVPLNARTGVVRVLGSAAASTRADAPGMKPGRLVGSVNGLQRTRGSPIACRRSTATTSRSTRRQRFGSRCGRPARPPATLAALPIAPRHLRRRAHEPRGRSATLQEAQREAQREAHSPEETQRPAARLMSTSAKHRRQTFADDCVSAPADG
jgi:hypothetical protein